MNHNAHTDPPAKLASAVSDAMKDSAGSADPLSFAATVSYQSPEAAPGMVPVAPDAMQGPTVPPKARNSKGAARAAKTTSTPTPTPITSPENPAPTPDATPTSTAALAEVVFAEKWNAREMATPGIFCRRCSEPCTVAARFCSACGAALVEPTVGPEEPKTPMILDAPGSVPARRPHVEGEPCSYVRVFPRDPKEHLTGNLGLGWWGATTIVLEAGVWHRVVPSVAAQLAKLLERSGKPTVQITNEATYQSIRENDQRNEASSEQRRRMQADAGITSQMVTGALGRGAPMPAPSTFEMMHGQV